MVCVGMREPCPKCGYCPHCGRGGGVGIEPSPRFRPQWRNDITTSGSDMTWSEDKTQVLPTNWDLSESDD